MNVLQRVVSLLLSGDRRPSSHVLHSLQGAESFCDRIGACASDYGLSHPIALYEDSTSCDFCINVVTHVKAIATDPQTEAELKSVLDKTCDHCPVKDEVGLAVSYSDSEAPVLN